MSSSTTGENDSSSLSKIAESIKRHDDALGALKNVPEMLQKLASAVGIAEKDRKEDKKKPSWSLGLSDDDDEEDAGPNIASLMGNADGVEIVEDSSQNAEFAEILKDIENKVEYGAELLPHVAASFVKTVKRPLTKDNKSAVQEKIKIPANCKEFVSPKVNQEIWRLLPQPAKMADLKSQQGQQILTSGLSVMATIAHTVTQNKDKIPKEVVANILQSTIDGCNIFGDHFQLLSTKRRHEMKKFLNPEYAGICNNSIPPGEWLFGDDLAENLKSSKVTSGLIKNVGAKNFRYKPYQRTTSSSSGSYYQSSLNSNRPFTYSSRGSGQHRFRPAFQSNPNRSPFQPTSQLRFKRPY